MQRQPRPLPNAERWIPARAPGILYFIFTAYFQVYEATTPLQHRPIFHAFEIASWKWPLGDRQMFTMLNVNRYLHSLAYRPIFIA
jgi:hypothetical protein